MCIRDREWAIADMTEDGNVIRLAPLEADELSQRARAAIGEAAPALSWPFKEAPYPASSTAWMTSEAEAVPSTPIEFVRRLTEQAVTPGTLETAFSTLALQAAQLMPVTVYCSIFNPPGIHPIRGAALQDTTRHHQIPLPGTPT